MKGYYSICAFIHNFTSLMWVFFGSKYAYLNTFSILHYFTLSDASVLMGFKVGSNIQLY